jgi:hypothetical protein
MTISPSEILDFEVISKVLAVDAEVAPPEQNSRHIRLRGVSPVNDDDDELDPMSGLHFKIGKSRITRHFNSLAFVLSAKEPNYFLPNLSCSF